MIFNFVLSNHPQERLKKMPDLLRPLQHGLAELDATDEAVWPSHLADLVRSAVPR